MRFDIRPLRQCGGRSLFIESTSTLPEDKFARSSFVAKCDMLDGWDDVMGAFQAEGPIPHLAGAILTTLSKRLPTVANLQLLHTFAVHRRKGVARSLVEHSLGYARKYASYFRVSSEPGAVDFYRACGLKFWGAQKSGTLLCIGRFDGDELVFDDCDPVVRAAVFSKRRGGVVDLYPAPT